MGEKPSELSVHFDAQLTPDNAGAVHVALYSSVKKRAFSGSSEVVERQPLMVGNFDTLTLALNAMTSALDVTKKPVHPHLALAFLSGGKPEKAPGAAVPQKGLVHKPKDKFARKRKRRR